MSTTVTDELLQEFLPTIRHWARHYAHRRHQVLDFDDLVVVGVLGLLDAARRFETAHGAQFKTYAEFRIRGEILDELRRQDWLGRADRRRQRRYRAENAHLTQELGHCPSTKELVKVLPFAPAQLEFLAELEAGAGPTAYVEGQCRAPVVDLEVSNEVGHLLEGLPEVEAYILRRYYLDDAPLEIIAREVKLSVSRVSQLHHQALARLRDTDRAA
jgi:RNA polymerase sigma factor for flagellar operon FliA